METDYLFQKNKNSVLTVDCPFGNIFFKQPFPFLITDFSFEKGIILLSATNPVSNLYEDQTEMHSCS